MKSKKVICSDILGQLIYENDTVKDNDGRIVKIEPAKYRCRFGFGDIYGFYVPDGCIKVESLEKA